MGKVVSFVRKDLGGKSKKFVEAPNYQAAHLGLIKEYNDLQKEIQIHSSAVNELVDTKARKKLAMAVMKLIELEETYEVVNEGKVITI